MRGSLLTYVVVEAVFVIVAFAPRATQYANSNRALSAITITD
jgi:hypothetical protein